MAGLVMLLETTTARQQKHHLLRHAARTTPLSCPSSSSSSRAPAPVASAACSSFLQRCFLCHRELAGGMDIYIYRGDREFCSEECRCRHILLEDDDDQVAVADRSRRQAVAGGFAL
ncbi:hypothetical protein HU200_008058 [Digitaria exilis]|uniref:FLZ-type domain-containing protein n=1 Tax=Digitaria exilis TaxID=1010633 RepID=A0A835FN73_9POAL|nr:hypothetical protein HU200_008058 [Digitaria exilis]